MRKRLLRAAPAYLAVGAVWTLGMARAGVANPTNYREWFSGLVLWPVEMGLVAYSYFEEQDE